MTRVVLAERQAKFAWAGHPNVYDGAIDRVEGEVKTGDEVDVVDHKERYVGRGVWHAESPVRVRIYRAESGPLDADFVRARIADAVRLRRDVLNLPARTEAFRVVHGDGDRFPGLVADLYGRFIVVQVTTFATAQRRTEIAEALLAECGAAGVWERASTNFAKQEGFHPGGGRLAGEAAPSVVEFKEDGVAYRVDLHGGAKTGHFLDQRDNRRAFAALCRGRRVLDVFCGTGGFGLAALVQGGAESVVAVDASKSATERFVVNATANGVEGRVETHAVDAFDKLRELVGVNARFDAVSVDPPRFAAAKTELPGAVRGYRELNLKAMQCLSPGGILATSSCTGVLSDEEFERVVRDAAVDARRRVQVLARTGQGPDHPWLTAVPESRYLKHFLARVL